MRPQGLEHFVLGVCDGFLALTVGGGVEGPPEPYGLLVGFHLYFDIVDFSLPLFGMPVLPPLEAT